MAVLGVWRSLVARSVRVGEVPSSNLGTPILMRKQTPYRRAAALLATCAAVLAAAGCGSSSHPLSVAVLTLRANAICAKLVTKEVTSSSGQSTEAGVRARLAEVDAAIGKLQALTPPASEETLYEGMITSVTHGDAFFKANLHRLFQLAKRFQANPNDQKDKNTYNKLTEQLGNLLSRAAKDATALALPECATGFGAGPGGSAG